MLHIWAWGYSLKKANRSFVTGLLKRGESGGEFHDIKRYGQWSTEPARAHFSRYAVTDLSTFPFHSSSTVKTDKMLNRLVKKRHTQLEDLWRDKYWSVCNINHSHKINGGQRESRRCVRGEQRGNTQWPTTTSDAELSVEVVSQPLSLTAASVLPETVT